MYFNDKNNTNIDNEFEKENILSKLLNFINKYKIIIVISILLIIGVIVIISISNNGSTIMKTNYYLELSGNEEITLYAGSDYIEPGYDAYNSKKEDMDSEVVIDSNLDVNVPGEYKITYSIGEVTKTRKVTVIAKPAEYSYIYLKTVNNNVNVYIKVGEDYVEPGYMVFSSSGKNLTSEVTVTGSVDTSKKGSYKLIYSLIDSNGVTVSATRTVIVMDSEISLSLSDNEYTNKDVTINVQVMDNYFDYMILPDNSKVTKTTTSYKVSENGTYTFTVYNKKGAKKETSIKVSNIDKIAPTGTCNGSYKNGVSTINVNASDNIGIEKYLINDKEYTSNKITINDVIKNNEITIYDKSGNSKNISCNIESKKSNLEMHFIASGPYDDAILIRTNDKTIFIDGGRWYCKDKVTPYLKTLGVKKIDAMIGSHLHYNHIQMQADILTNFEVGDIYYPDDIFTCADRRSCDLEDQKYIVSELKNQNRTPIIAKPGKKVVIGEMELYFIGPENIVTGGSYPQNYNSSIMILKFYDTTFMFTGDAANSTLDLNNLQKHANNLGINLNVDLLKYPHHGNATLKDNFLETVDPEIIIVPNYNASKFPATSNTNKLKNYDITMYRQSDSSTGNILITSDGEKITVTNNIKAENYTR